jgi:ribonuclease inhibitor
MTARRCVLTGKETSLDAVYRAMAEQLGFPAWAGRNLDALWDVLTTEIPGPVEIVWTGSAEAKRTLGADFDHLVAVLRDVAERRPDFRLILA